MKISKKQYDYIHNDLYLIDYIIKILRNEYFYWRNKNENKARHIYRTISGLEFSRTQIYKKRSDYVRAVNELEKFTTNQEQLQLNI